MNKHLENSICKALGYTAVGVSSGVKKNHKLDLALIHSAVPAVAAGVFTLNKLKAAPLKLTQKNIKNGLIQAIVINSGNANACTGKTGMSNAKKMAQHTAQSLNVDINDVAVASTGVIGQQLAIDKIIAGIHNAGVQLNRHSGHSAAQAIMTTDTFSKETFLQTAIDGKTVTIGGVAKGSGMIHPNMATMLAFITTDVDISHELLVKALKDINANSFNMISVDGDSSTNDMVIVLANKLAGNKAIVDINSQDYKIFYSSLLEVCTNLAKQIVMDGEGATKTFEVNVIGAKNEKQAKIIARTISASSLVKAALFGDDANWGRIACAVGYSQTSANVNKMQIALDDYILFSDGLPIKFDEEIAKTKLCQKLVKVNVDLKLGHYTATAWGCDLSYDYVKINAEYFT